jgi:hypothetical protein
MNLQRLIDQHPAVFAAIFPIYFLCLWFLGGGDNQLHWRLVLAGEDLSDAGAVQWDEMENTARTDAVAGELQQRADAWSQSAGFVFGQHVPFSVHAPSAACSMERDQGAKEEGLGVRVRAIHNGT